MIMPELWRISGSGGFENSHGPQAEVAIFGHHDQETLIGHVLFVADKPIMPASSDI